MGSDETRSRTAAGDSYGDGSCRADVADILRGLLDVQLRTIVTTRLAPVIYIFLIIGVVYFNLYLAIQAFGHSRAFGLLWTLLVAPVLCVVGVIAVRVALEVILCIFRIVLEMETLMERLSTLQGQTQTIVEDLPRIQFWRTRRRSHGGAE